MKHQVETKQSITFHSPFLSLSVILSVYKGVPAVETADKVEYKGAENIRDIRKALKKE